MSADMQQPTSEQMLAAENNTITTDTNTPGVADHKAAAQIDASKGYTPVFSETIRTVIYVVGLAAVLAGGGVALAGHADIGEYIICSLFFPSQMAIAYPIAVTIGNLVDPPATMINAAGDYVVTFLVARFTEGKDWLERARQEKK